MNLNLALRLIMKHKAPSLHGTPPDAKHTNLFLYFQTLEFQFTLFSLPQPGPTQKYCSQLPFR